MNITDLYASIKNQARRAVYDERDDSAHFEQFHWVKDEAIRRRILVERAIVRRAVRDILAADDGAYCISVYDGEEYPVKRSRDLDKIMSNIGQCDEETIIVRHFNQDGTTGGQLGCIYLVYGNGGWDVIADHTDSPLMHELLQEANRLANVLGALIAASPAIPSSTSIQAGALVRIKMDLTDSDEDGQDRITPAGSIGLLTEGYDESNWNVVFANGATQVFSNEELGRASECEFVPSDSPEGIEARAAIDAASDEASQETMTAPVQAAGAGTRPGELLRSFREYLTVHPGIELGGHDMDNMALDLTRIALTALAPNQQEA